MHAYTGADSVHSGSPRFFTSAKASPSFSSVARRIFVMTPRPLRSCTRPLRSQLLLNRYVTCLNMNLLYRLLTYSFRVRKFARRLEPTSISNAPHEPTRVFVRSSRLQPGLLS